MVSDAHFIIDKTADEGIKNRLQINSFKPQPTIAGGEGRGINVLI